MFPNLVASLLISICLIGTGCAGQTGKPQDDPLTFITNITVVDPVSGLHPDTTVVIKGGRIHRVDKAVNITGTATNRVINGEGKFLIPGLWDMHVHFTFDPQIGNRMFPLFIANGVTSVRDTGGQLDQVLYWRNRSKVEKIAPRVYVSGPLVDGTPLIYDGAGPHQPNLGTGVKTPAETRRLVDTLAARGVDFIKAYELLSKESFGALMAQARYYNLPVAGHVPLSMTATSVSNLGLNSIEHLRNIEQACADNATELEGERLAVLANHRFNRGYPLRKHLHKLQRTPAVRNQNPLRCSQLIARFAENQTRQTPTLNLIAFPLAKLYARESWLDTFKYLDSETEAEWQEFAVKQRTNSPPQERLDYAEWGRRLVYKMHQGGVEIMAGTDTPILLQTPGFSLHEELRQMVEAGLSTMDALRTATLNPPKFFGLASDMGTIEPGKLADLVVLDANPLDDIGNTQKINAVISRGRYFSRTAIDKMLAALASSQP